MIELTTVNLKLRSLILSDANDLYNLRFNDEVTRFINREKPKKESDIIKFIKERIHDVEKGKILFWVISILDNPKLIGTICLWNFNDTKTVAEIGYELHPDFHGKGLMSEAIEAVLNFGFKNLQLKTIEAFTSKYNESSKALLNKFDFKLEAKRIDKGFPDNIIYTKQNA